MRMSGRGMGRLGMAGGQMGITCQPGFYELKVFGISTGQCAPSLDTALNAAQGGVVASVATGVATNPANIAAASNAGLMASFTKATSFVKAHPIGVAAAVAATLALVVYGGMSFARGK